MIKSKKVAFILYVLVFFVFGNLLDYLIVTFLTHGTFTFSVFGLSLVPTVVCLVTGYFVVFREDAEKKTR